MHAGRFHAHSQQTCLTSAANHKRCLDIHTGKRRNLMTK